MGRDFSFFFLVVNFFLRLVYKALFEEKEMVVALKKIHLASKSDEGFPMSAIREIKLLRNLSHNNIIEVIDIVTTKEKFCFYTPISID